ncbi:hypothetical protein [Pseudomonas sp. S2_F03]
MKYTTLIVAGLMTFGSATAFAEYGSERMQYYYETLHLAQQKANGFEVKNIELRVPSDQTAQMTESYQTEVIEASRAS